MKDWPKEAMRFARRALPEIMSADPDDPEVWFGKLASKWQAERLGPAPTPESAPPADKSSGSKKSTRKRK